MLMNLLLNYKLVNRHANGAKLKRCLNCARSSQWGSEKLSMGGVRKKSKCGGRVTTTRMLKLHLKCGGRVKKIQNMGGGGAFFSIPPPS